jgi:hypothetical protein
MLNSVGNVWNTGLKDSQKIEMVAVFIGGSIHV